MMQDIERLIEEEVQRRVDARVGALIEHIANRWDISILQLSKDVSKFAEVKIDQCLGHNKKTKKRCRNRSRENGYCHAHQSQVPKAPPKTSVVQEHTHTLPPFYLKGCPACDKAKTPIHINEQVGCTSRVSEEVFF
jgi:hypothetical protein